jgi:hypothetical protein
LRDETTTWQATGEDSENLDALVNDINTSKSLILHSAAIVRLGFQVPKELTAQALEKINCTGPIKIRKYGWLGKVISIDCGSLERKERLKNHLNENFHTGQSELGQTL